jgi:hypothetical protein
MAGGYHVSRNNARQVDEEIEAKRAATGTLTPEGGRRRRWSSQINLRPKFLRGARHMRTALPSDVRRGLEAAGDNQIAGAGTFRCTAGNRPAKLIYFM